MPIYIHLTSRMLMRRLLRRFHQQFWNTKSRQPVVQPPESIDAPPASIDQPPPPVAAPPESMPAPPESMPAPPETPSCAETPLATTVCSLLRAAVRSLRPPIQGLPDGERQRLGGLIFSGAVHFVQRTADVLRERPDLSPAPARINAAALDGRQLRAIEWSMVHAAASRLAELANDCYLHELGSAVAESQQVIQAHELAMAQSLLHKGPDARLIEDAMQIDRVKVVLRRCGERRRSAQLRQRRKIKEAQVPPAPRGKPREEKAPLIDLARWGRNAKKAQGT